MLKPDRPARRSRARKRSCSEQNREINRQISSCEVRVIYRERAQQIGECRIQFAGCRPCDYIDTVNAIKCYDSRQHPHEASLSTRLRGITTIHSHQHRWSMTARLHPDYAVLPLLVAGITLRWRAAASIASFSH